MKVSDESEEGDEGYSGDNRRGEKNSAGDSVGDSVGDENLRGAALERSDLFLEPRPSTAPVASSTTRLDLQAWDGRGLEDRAGEELECYPITDQIRVSVTGEKVRVRVRVRIHNVAVSPVHYGYRLGT